METRQRKWFSRTGSLQYRPEIFGMVALLPQRGSAEQPPPFPPPRTLRFCGDQGVALELAHVAASRTHCVSRTAALPEAPETSWPPVPLAVAGAAGVRRAAALLLARRSSRPPPPPADFPIRASLALSASRGAGSGLLRGARGRGRGQGPGQTLDRGQARPGRKGAEPEPGRSPGDWDGAGQGAAWKTAGKAQGLLATTCATGAQTAE